MSAASRPLAYALAVGCIAALLTYFAPYLQELDVNSVLRFDLNSLLQSVNGPLKEVDWAARQEHYPVQNYIPIPDSTRKQLPRIQHEFKPEPESKASTRQQRQKEVRLVIDRSWRSYLKHGYPQDELKAISGSSYETYGNWSLTLVESLDTLWLAGFKDEFKEAVDLVSTINFNTTTNQDGINVYEVLSRFLGGLLSAYDLSRNRRLKDKALELATILYAAFDTPSRMPNIDWDMMTTKRGVRQQVPMNAAIGEVGGLALEFTRLSHITHDDKWYDVGARIMKKLSVQQEIAPYPGLMPVVVDLQDDNYKIPGEFNLGEESQAFYATLPNMYAMLHGSDQYKKMAKSAINSIIQNLLFRPMLPPGNNLTDILLPGTLINNTLHPKVDHAACSIAGTLAYTSHLLRNDTYLATARALLRGCLWASQASPLGIMPATFTVTPCPSQNPKAPCEWDESLYNTHLLTLHDEPSTAPSTPQILTWKHRLPQGFTSITSRHYTLHHSLISSIFMLYRITGDESLQEEAYTLWKSVYGRSKTKFAHAVIEDVTMPNAPKLDLMPSGFMGATLKYFLLMFGGPGKGTLEWFVPSSEGHFLRGGGWDRV